MILPKCLLSKPLTIYAGCVTCKQKRLKCDETKPTCQQCAKRQVTCGGYKKDFKWRPFEEASFVTTKSSTTPCPKANKDGMCLLSTGGRYWLRYTSVRHGSVGFEIGSVGGRHDHSI